MIIFHVWGRGGGGVTKNIHYNILTPMEVTENSNFGESGGGGGGVLEL